MSPLLLIAGLITGTMIDRLLFFFERNLSAAIVRVLLLLKPLARNGADHFLGGQHR
jgi:hypothetical protein